MGNNIREIVKIKCKDCGETFEHQTLHSKRSTKQICGYCKCLRHREYSRKQREKNKRKKI